MSGFHDPRASFASAGSAVQRVGAEEGASLSAADVSVQPNAVLRFGIFELDTRTLELRRDGLLIHLRHKPVQVLRFLLERAGHLVTRSEITNEIWPNDIDIDVEQGLNHCIKEIRVALADRAESPRYIQTLPRRGYRVVADVRDMRDARSAAAAFTDAAPPATAIESQDGNEKDETEVRRGPRNFE